tara:strand:- start:3124 stop:3594 length:471 start_codon:yes stop_codon:yes gene_type:complete
MANLFYDVLPYDIQEYIYGISLSNMLTKKYRNLIARKMALAVATLRITSHVNGHMVYVYNPFDTNVSYIINKCSNLLSRNDDVFWWTCQLIRPIERGIIEYADVLSANMSVVENQIDESSPWHNQINIYFNTEYACDKLIHKFKIRKDPRRPHSIS